MLSVCLLAIFPKSLIYPPTLILKQGKLKHAAVYVIKFRILKDIYNAISVKHPGTNDLVYSYLENSPKKARALIG